MLLKRMPLDLMEVGQVCVAIFPGDMSCNRAMITKKSNVSLFLLVCGSVFLRLYEDKGFKVNC